MEAEEEQRAPGKTRGEMIGLAVSVIVLILVLAAASAPLLLKSRKAADRTEAINNIKQTGAMLVEFDTEYGSFPGKQTAEDVKKATGTELNFDGTFSNDYFRQMLAGGGGKSEKPFWCKTAQSPKKADDNFSSPAKALEAGEVGFSYIMASPTQGQKASDEPTRPVVVTPSYKFQTDWTFDPDIHKGKAVVLRIDGSAMILQIREGDRKIITSPGKTLGDTGEGTPWGTKVTPCLRAPQPR